MEFVRLEFSLCEAFDQSFVNETGKTLRLHQNATIAEDARMKAPRIRRAHGNHIRLFKEIQDMKKAKLRCKLVETEMFFVSHGVPLNHIDSEGDDGG